MLYSVDYRYFDKENMLLLVILVILIGYFIWQRRNISMAENFCMDKSISIKYIIGNSVCIFLCIIIGLGLCMRICQKAYYGYVYTALEYRIEEGKVEKLEYIYAKNSKRIIGIKFYVNETYFVINNGLLNVSYSYDDLVITKNGERFKIYYLPSYRESINTILRIDTIR